MELSLLQKQCKIITFTIGRWSTISTAEHCMFTCWITGNTHITKLKEFLKTNNGIILYWRAWTIIPRPGWVSAIHLMNPHRNNEELHNEASCNSQKDEGFFFSSYLRPLYCVLKNPSRKNNWKEKYNFFFLLSPSQQGTEFEMTR